MSLRQHPVVWVGLAIVLGAAAVLSFVGLRDLAVAVGLGNLDGEPSRLAWLLPVSVDAGAAVSCAVWLAGAVHQDAARFARRMTVALLTTTVVGQAVHLGMHALDVRAPWWLAVLVGAIPPAVVGGCVHLAVLVVRRQPASVAPEPASGATESPDLLERAEALVAELGKVPGRPTLRRELDVTDHQAKELQRQLSATNGSEPAP